MRPEEAITRQVKGWLVPIFQSRDEGGRTLNGLCAEDFAKVCAGYACSDCLAVFDTYTVTCPVCGTTRDVDADIREAPPLWLQHLRERDLDEPADKPPVVNPFAGGTVLPEMETIPLAKLRKRKWGRS